jgi:hypothetical protein
MSHTQELSQPLNASSFTTSYGLGSTEFSSSISLPGLEESHQHKRRSGARSGSSTFLLDRQSLDNSFKKSVVSLGQDEVDSTARQSGRSKLSGLNRTFDRSSNAINVTTASSQRLDRDLIANSDMGVQTAVTTKEAIADPLLQGGRTPGLTSQIMTGSSLSTGSLADNALSTATNLGTINGNTLSTVNFVGSSDTQDYYRFTLGSTGAFNLALTGMTADADVQLLNSSGTVLRTANLSSSRDESMNLASLAAGNYAIRVYQYSGDTNYRLHLSNLNPSNLLAVETNVGTLSGTRVFSGAVNNSSTIGSSNTADVYRFSLGATTGNFNLTLSGMSADADVRLIRDTNNNGIVDVGEVLGSSLAGNTGGEWISQSLAAGNYFVQVYKYGGDTNYNLSLSTGDWYNQNLSDAGIIGQARALYYTDGSLSRTDMISILREAKDHTGIDSAELTDLRKIVNPSTGFSTPEYVRNLANKVVNSDPANPRSGFGNLYSGSSSTQMENLIGKWFLGTDRPDAHANSTYRYVSGSLFQNGASQTDVAQGAEADCYLLAGLASTAHRTPNAISNMFIDNGDGTFTVRYFNNGVADYVTVDRYLPTRSNGTAFYQGWGGGVNTSTSNELWVALAEKAYAQINESGWLGRNPSENSYSSIGWGDPGAAIRQITNRTPSWYGVSTNADKDALISKINSGQIVVLATKSETTALIKSHAYVVTGYNSTTGLFSLYNPWGSDHANIGWGTLSSNSQAWAATA